MKISNTTYFKQFSDNSVHYYTFEEKSSKNVIKQVLELTTDNKVNQTVRGVKELPENSEQIEYQDYLWETTLIKNKFVDFPPYLLPSHEVGELLKKALEEKEKMFVVVLSTACPSCRDIYHSHLPSYAAQFNTETNDGYNAKVIAFFLDRNLYDPATSPLPPKMYTPMFFKFKDGTYESCWTSKDKDGRTTFSTNFADLKAFLSSPISTEQKENDKQA